MASFFYITTPFWHVVRVAYSIKQAEFLGHLIPFGLIFELCLVAGIK